MKTLSSLLLACLFAKAHGTPLQNGFFLGLGASYNSIKIDQQLAATAFSSLFSGSTLVALGNAGGQADPYRPTHSTFSPEAELGYFHRFAKSPWFFGCKAVYQTLDLAFENDNIDSFPPGAYTSTVDGNTWIGHVSISSAQTLVNHELFLLPLFGYSFSKSRAYLGIGPVLFGTKNHLYGIASSVRLNGTASDTATEAANRSYSRWIWGGIAQLGWIAAFTSSWFLDLAYSYGATENSIEQDSFLFSNSLVTGSAYTNEGILSYKNKQRISAQSLTVTINTLF